ncbi:hypothetical protein HHK36_024280 [Tetracentron sinense]|uniref:CRAL-TRIO domain-containing protein n=1 Tax=Tetracentron sinense TaxID=13715 RepID=A0A835D4H7_TETSI|nr:hypothetical protein HHK36_024280 [Tetracentron sinense]
MILRLNISSIHHLPNEKRNFASIASVLASFSDAFDLTLGCFARVSMLFQMSIGSSLQLQPDLGWMRRLQQILGRKHQRHLHAIYVLHPTFGLKAAILGLQLFVDGEVWKKVVYVDRLLQLFRYIPREQLSIPDFVFQLSFLYFSFKLKTYKKVGFGSGLCTSGYAS